MTSNPSWPPNAIDFAIDPRTSPSAVIARNWTPISAAKSAFEKTENIRLKKSPKPRRTRSSGARAEAQADRDERRQSERRPPVRDARTALASPRPRRRPESTVSVIEIPGTSATFSHASSSSNQRAAIAPGTTSSSPSAKSTQSVCAEVAEDARVLGVERPRPARRPSGRGDGAGRRRASGPRR